MEFTENGKLILLSTAILLAVVLPDAGHSEATLDIFRVFVR